MFNKKILGLIASLMFLGVGVNESFATCLINGADTQICETKEILYSTGEGAVVGEKAASLGNAVKIYEYIRNNAEYAPYHGARSSSINTVLGMRGNDVDLAGGLIAMLRSQGIKSRYVEGDIKIPKSQLANWLGVINNDLAVAVLRDQGLQHIDDSDPDNVIFQHAWVEALVDYDNYRAGNTTSSVACTEAGGSCKWISLDPSFKQKIYKNTNKTLLRNLNFNYNAYYNAENPSSPDYVPGMKNKNPLEIYEELAMEYLRTNHPGVTLEDVIDSGVIIQDKSGLLPASLPYEVIGSITRYDSVSAYDLANTIDWSKYVTSTMQLPGCASIGLPSYTVSVAELSTKQLTLTMFEDNGTKIFSHRLDGVKVGSSISASGTITFICNGVSTVVQIGTPMDVELKIDAAPGDDPVTVKYEKLTFGGYYLIATGGETSNWTQVKRAYKKLLAANDEYAIVVDTNGTIGVAGIAYVDTNASGVADVGDIPLLSHLAAQDALTGGLLHVAQTLYYTRLREESQRYSKLKGIISPVAAYIGIVSTTHEVEYLDNVPFAVTPGGLLIDLKGIRINGSWEVDSPATYSNETFKFLGHVASSLEHEIWQEITGYDAISTMRGIQLAMGTGEKLLDVNYNPPTSNSFPSATTDLGFSNVAPVDFSPNRYQLFGRDLQTWTYTGTDTAAGFNVFRPDVSGIPADDSRALWLSYSGDSGLDGFVANMDSLENQLITLSADDGQLKSAVPFTITGTESYTFLQASVTSPSGFSVNQFYKNASNLVVIELNETTQHADGIYPVVVAFAANTSSGLVTGSVTLNMDVADSTYSFTCSQTTVTSSGSATQLLVDLETCFNDTLTLEGITQSVDFLDINKGFSPTTSAYRSYSLNINDYELNFIKEMRNHMYYVTTPNARFQYIVPAHLSQGPNYLFSVYIKNGYLNEDLSTSTYAIVNYSNRLVAGGGYVTAEETVVPAKSSDFNNEVFTNLNLVSVTNNDVVRTPSTSDPVSTVTGNMYHDETDIVIKGRGLDYAFTRTYNSDQVKTTTASNLPLSKGWTHSYNMRLIANDYGKNPNFTVAQAPENGNGTTSSITYIDERGGELNYLVDDINSTWAITAPRMNFDQLALDTPTVGSYTLTFRNGVKYIFSGGDLKVPGNIAKLSTVEDPYGNQLNFGYNTAGQLANITDNTGISGRTGLTLTYYPVGHADEGHLQTITDWSGRSWTYAYTNGQLTSVINPLNDAMTYSYVPGTDLLQDIINPEVRNGQQKSMTFSYYENDQAYSYIDKLGQIESVTYDLFRKRTRITNPRGFITEHYYDENGAMIKLVEPDKAILQFANNENGLRYLKRDALGYATTYSYNQARTLDGAATDTYGQVTREQDALGNTTDYTYGIYDQVTRVKNKNNIESVSNYYASTDLAVGALAGKLQNVTMPRVKVNGVDHLNVVIASYQYNADGTVKHIEEMVDPATPTRKRVTDNVYTYDATGFTLTKTITGATSGGVVATSQRYDALWRLQSESVNRRTSATDATIITLTTRYEYDDLNRPIKVTDALGNITETVYDKNGQVKQVTKRFALNNAGINTRALHNGCSIEAAYPNHHSCVITTRSYDLADRLISETDLNGNKVSYQYDAMGNVTKITNKRGHSLDNEYDARGRLIRVTNENGYSVKTDYDLAGRVIANTDPNGNTTRFSYDALGRKTSITTPQGRVTTFDQYDGNGNLIKQKDANGVSGKQPLNSQGASLYKVYDEFNRVISELNANNEETRYTYDLLGNLTSVTDAKGQVTTFIYDDLGRLIEVKDPIVESPTDKTRSYSHDELGNILTATDRNGEVVRTTYDRQNRATLVEYLADATTQTARYNQYGELDQIANGSVTYNYTYDNRQRMTQKVDSRSGKSLNWAYDVAGNMISKIDYQGNTTTYTYDDTNRLVAMENKGLLQASYHYDGAGRLLSRILSNGSATLYQYDKDSLLTKLSQRSSGGTIVDERSFTHDDVGNITGVTRNTGEVVSYTYDPVYRLKTSSSTITANNLSYSYDAVGNRTSKTDNTNSYYYIFNNSGNRLDETRTGSVTGPILYTYDYDDNGSRIAKRNSLGTIIESYVYDQRRLISSITDSGLTSTFGYDPNAYRTQKTTTQGQNNYLLEGEHLEATYDETGTLKASYLRGVVVDEIIGSLEKDQNGNMKYNTFHHDQVNSVTALTNHNGQTVQTRSYTPFGMNQSISGTSSNALNYTGREQDSNDLYYYRARYYDPETGRFLSEDPLGFEAGINFYAYVGNNPINYNDPTGNYALVDDAVFTIGGAVVGVAAQGAVDLFRGEISPWQDYVAAGVGGAVAGETLLYAGPIVAGAAGGAASNLTKQGLNWATGQQNEFSVSSLAFDTTVGAATGLIPGVKVPGITQGRNSYNAIYKQIGTKFQNDTISNVSTGTAMKMFTGRATDTSFLPGSLVATGASFGYETVTSDVWLPEYNFNDFGDPNLNFPTLAGSGAGGGFVIYPNKTNTNMLRSIYSK